MFRKNLKKHSDFDYSPSLREFKEKIIGKETLLTNDELHNNIFKLAEKYFSDSSGDTKNSELITHLKLEIEKRRSNILTIFNDKSLNRDKISTDNQNIIPQKIFEKNAKLDSISIKFLCYKFDFNYYIEAFITFLSKFDNIKPLKEELGLIINTYECLLRLNKLISNELKNNFCQLEVKGKDGMTISDKLKKLEDLACLNYDKFLGSNNKILVSNLVLNSLYCIKPLPENLENVFDQIRSYSKKFNRSENFILVNPIEKFLNSYDKQRHTGFLKFQNIFYDYYQETLASLKKVKTNDKEIIEGLKYFYKKLKNFLEAILASFAPIFNPTILKNLNTFLVEIVNNEKNLPENLKRKRAESPHVSSKKIKDMSQRSNRDEKNKLAFFSPSMTTQDSHPPVLSFDKLTPQELLSFANNIGLDNFKLFIPSLNDKQKQSLSTLLESQYNLTGLKI